MVALHAVLLGFPSVINSATTDEVVHLSSGISHWHLGRFELGAVNPPLVRIVGAFPVLALKPKVDWTTANERPATVRDHETFVERLSLPPPPTHCSKAGLASCISFHL